MPGAHDLRQAGQAVLPVAAAGALVGLLAATWSGLWREAPTGRLALVAAIGVMPALVRVTSGRRSSLWASLCAAVAAIVVLAVAVGSDPVALVGVGSTWNALGDIIPEGLGNASTTPLPLAVDRAPALSALLILVLAGAACLVAWQIVVARRPLAGIIAAATGLAYRWTLVPPSRPVLTGALTLVIALAVFRLAGPRRTTWATSGRTALTGGIVVALAVLGSAGADRAPASWWDWRDWTFGAGQGPTSLSLKQSYGPLTYPDEPVLVARVEADEPIPLRAVTLERFDGTSFVQSATPTEQGGTRGRVRLSPDERGDPRSVSQKITLGNARTPWLLAGGRPAEVDGVGRREVTVFTDGAVRVQPALAGDTAYTVQTLVPDPGPAALLRAGRYIDVDPGLLSVLPGQGSDVVTVPVWGSTGSAAARLDPQEFRQYAQVYELSRRVIGDARTPYTAVNRIEAYLRKLDYSDTVQRPIGNPDLVDFLLVSRRGYCQHFAGAMALMLRMNGIPARVAVGFTSDPGRFDREKKSYEIIDRDAHSWVEVLFPGFGWIPFDPTPGRSVPNTASVSSSAYSSGDIDLDVAGKVEPAPVRPTAPIDPSLREPAFTDVGAPGGDGSGARAWLWTIPAALLLAFLTPLGAKSVRRARRRRGDERARVIGAARELESLLVDLGHPPDPSATTAERARTGWRDLGIDAAAVYGLASSARFDPSPPPAGAGDEAWRALRTVRRAIGWRKRVRAGLRFRSLRG